MMSEKIGADSPCLGCPNKVCKGNNPACNIYKNYLKAKAAEKQMPTKEELRTIELNCKFCVDRGKVGKLGAFMDDEFTTYRECMTCGHQWNEKYFEWLYREYGDHKKRTTAMTWTEYLPIAKKELELLKGRIETLRGKYKPFGDRITALEAQIRAVRKEASPITEEWEQIDQVLREREEELKVIEAEVFLESVTVSSEIKIVYDDSHRGIYLTVQDIITEDDNESGSRTNLKYCRRQRERQKSEW